MWAREIGGSGICGVQVAFYYHSEAVKLWRACVGVLEHALRLLANWQVFVNYVIADAERLFLPKIAADLGRIPQPPLDVGELRHLPDRFE
jgi:hypothetical protein